MTVVGDLAQIGTGRVAVIAPPARVAETAATLDLAGSRRPDGSPPPRPCQGEGEGAGDADARAVGVPVTLASGGGVRGIAGGEKVA